MPEPEFPERFFEREDETPDSLFYGEPRFVAHIDDETISALTAYYREFLPSGSRVLDLMSSWISHLPDDAYARVSGLGMNERELAANPRLTDAVVHDLNVDPRLPYEDAAFERAVIAVSIQYLVRPMEVFRDLVRVLVPGGRVAIAMSHRCFPTKAILAFRALGPRDRVRLVSTYLHQAGFVDIAFEDRSPPRADPLWIVAGTRPLPDPDVRDDH
ncbi:MAG: methyltransferase domain-containing protein [Gammaproteobacteria bacterium]|nr:methyltransferase domain-containing protein [Gammaproteobacteria bacterium]